MTRIRSLLLAFLAEDVFAGVLHALALIGFRLAIAADLRCNLANPLLVDAGNHDFGRLRALDVDAFRDRIEHFVAETEVELQVLALDRRTVANAVNFKRLREAFGHAVDEVLHQRAGQTPHRASALRVLTGRNLDP